MVSLGQCDMSVGQRSMAVLLLEDKRTATWGSKIYMQELCRLAS